ncbi:hypothetical protein [Candidatus Borreliella tachyglossi]|uniref:hypothetical protein n=1 Tax=Candidatus Borreliella tachyglossi TaxID=1964448 RepID=UPI00404156FC
MIKYSKNTLGQEVDEHFLEQLSYIRSYLGFSPNLKKNGNGLIGKVEGIKREHEEFKKDTQCKLNNLKKLVIAKFENQEKIASQYYNKLFAEIEQIKQTNISFHTFNNIGTFILKVSAVVTALFGMLKIVGWV